ncbi:MAG: hypothetical protein JRI51_06715 [Deltaproteobacteria bacterium]|nr:hypothetical protein [Deltaproteobacteria bacterium]
MLKLCPSHIPRTIRLTALFLCFFFIFAGSPFAYLLSASQVLQRMIKNFSPFETLVIVQWAKVVEGADGQEQDLMEQKVWIDTQWQASCKRVDTGKNAKDPDLEASRCGWCRIEKIEGMFINRPVSEMINFLSSIGIKTSRMSLTHLGAKVAYVIGRNGKRDSHILISRDKFLPIALRIWDINSPGGPFTVRFEEYRRVGEGWYPYRITCETDLGQKHQYVIQEIRPNMPIEASVFKPAKNTRVNLPPKPSRHDLDENKVKDVIRILEEKYQ